MKTEWDLTLLYKNDLEWQEDYEKIEQYIEWLNKNISNIFTNIDSFLEFLKTKIETERIIDRTFSYAKRQVHKNLTQTEYKEKMKKTLDLYGKLQIISNEFDRCIIEKSDIVTIYLQNPILSQYKRLINLIIRKKAHLISNSDILIDYSNKLQEIRNSYQDILVNKIKETEIVYEGETITITRNNINELLLDDNQEKRKLIYQAYMKLISKYGKEIKKLYKSKLTIEIELSRQRNFKYLIEEKMFNYEIDNNFFEMVLKTIKKHIQTKHKYNEIKKSSLNLKKFSNYDTLLSICDIPKINIDLIEGKNKIKKALSIFGEEYILLIDKMFNDGWIDAYPKENKIGGSYTSIAYDGVPFILLNYEGSITSLRLLAHEIGHAVNTYFSKKANGYHNFSVTFFLTEIASKVNELLLNEYLIEHANNDEEKIYILNDVINALINSIYGQTLFSDFENNAVKSIEIFGKFGDLNKLFRDLEEEYNGSAFNVEKSSKYEWLKMSHYIMQDSYYVYQYSVGACLSVYIVNKLLNDKNNFKEKYLKFLSLGDRLSITEILKELEIEINNDNFIIEGIEYLNQKIQKLEDLLKRKELILKKNNIR